MTLKMIQIKRKRRRIRMTRNPRRRTRIKMTVKKKKRSNRRLRTFLIPKMNFPGTPEELVSLTFQKVFVFQ